MILKGCNFLRSTKTPQSNTLNPHLLLYKYCHFESKDELGFDSSCLTSTSAPKPQNKVAIFWDLDNKPPNSFPPYEAACKLRIAASSFGIVKYMVAYANRHAFSYVPKVVREQRMERKLLNQLENRGVIKPVEPYLCRVCGRNFYNHDKLVNHFKQIHEREHQKRMNQIESARGKRRVNLVAKYAMKMQKYKNAAREILTPKVGYGLADELKKAGFWIRTVSDKPQAADRALRDQMVDVMHKRRAECLVLVSDDSDFVDVLKEAKLMCLKTVVVGDINDGVLKRIADAGFSWQEILKGKAKKEAPSVVGKWKDHEILKRLEWKYSAEDEKKVRGIVDEFYDCVSEEEDVDEMFKEDADDFMQVEDADCWRELGSDPKINS